LKKLILTADDFGAAREVNDAIEMAHAKGILTAASLMVGAPEAADAVARAKRMPSLRVGLHLVLVEGRPVLPARDVSDLVDGNGQFRTDMAAAGARMFFSPRARAQLAAEIEAQFAAFAATGLPLDHCNAHKHFHLHPTIGGLIARIGRRFGLKSVRLPYEPKAVLAKIEPTRGAAVDWVIAPWLRVLRARLRAAGMLTPDFVFGLSWSGAMTEQRLAGLMRHLPDGLSEIYLHPAASDAFPGSAPGYRYRDELSALTAPACIAAAGAISRGGFADFLPSRDGGTFASVPDGARSSTP
jgi:hopanoid biosynthesis associated protein HpnK